MHKSTFFNFTLSKKILGKLPHNTCAAARFSLRDCIQVNPCNKTHTNCFIHIKSKPTECLKKPAGCVAKQVCAEQSQRKAFYTYLQGLAFSGSLFIDKHKHAHHAKKQNSSTLALTHILKHEVDKNVSR